MNGVQRQIEAQYGKAAYGQLTRSVAVDLPAAWVAPPEDPDCRCMDDRATAAGFITVDGKVRLCGGCALGQWRADGMGLKAYG